MNFFFNKKKEVPINPKFKEMSHEELLLTAKTLKDANNNVKGTLNQLTTQNNELKDSILNRQKNSSELKNIYRDLKYTLFSSNEVDINEKNKDFNDFLYDQYLLYDGIEEEEINYLNQLKIKEDNWSDNKDIFIFKQKIIERNYQELFKNILASKELKQLYGIKNNEITNNINEINNKENTIIKKESNIKDEKKENKDIKLETLSDKIEPKQEKKKENKSEEKEKKNNSNKFNVESINPIKNLKKEDKKNNYFLDGLLDEENNDDDNGISFKDLTNGNKNNGWDEE